MMQNHLVAFLDRIDCLAHLDHLAKVLVSEYLPLLNVGSALVHVEIRAADIGCRELYDYVCEFVDFGVGKQCRPTLS
jgi:hypothetical protein